MTMEIVLLIAVVALAVYCAFLARGYAHLSQRFENVSRRYAILAASAAMQSMHVLQMPEQLRYPGGKDGFWRVRCSCTYTTGACPTEARAWKAASDHLLAMTRPSS